jgi:hypothetical protein
VTTSAAAAQTTAPARNALSRPDKSPKLFSRDVKFCFVLLDSRSERILLRRGQWSRDDLRPRFDCSRDELLARLRGLSSEERQAPGHTHQRYNGCREGCHLCVCRQAGLTKSL